jgi:hypothetical protein
VTNKPAATFYAMLVFAWNRAKDTANTLRDQLTAEMLTAQSLVSAGSLATVAKNSTSQAYKGFGAGADTQSEIRDAWVDLIALYDQVKNELTNAFTASADFDYTVPADFDFDPVIADPVTGILSKNFLAQSTGVAQLRPDLSGLRLPPCAILGPVPTTW